MAKKIAFTKMQGAGNDYIYVNTLLYSIDDPAAAAVKWSAPHFGIGSDGLVLIGRPTNPETADYSMHIYNADGSEAMMCGNASRCIGKYLYEKGMTMKTTIRLETLSGVKILKLHLDDDNKVKSVTVDMLEPRLQVPEQYTGATVIGPDDSLRPLLADKEGVFVSMGNPHWVNFVRDVREIEIEKEGKALEHHAAFPQRCNIEFAQVVGKDQLRTRVWERGSGITMACGTGACATAVAAALRGLTSRNVDILMDGGTLHIEWNANDNHVYMTGPAAFVFDGEIEE